MKKYANLCLLLTTTIVLLIVSSLAAADMVVTETGKVGISTDTPGYELTVNGSIGTLMVLAYMPLSTTKSTLKSSMAG